jgi:thymidylate kinase
MIYVLEGPDGCGKTTLAHDLIKRYGGKYWHCGVVPNIYQLHHGIVERCKDEPEVNHFIDRLYLSESIYSALFRNGESYDTEHFATTFEHKTIFCLVPEKEYYEHHKKNADREMYHHHLDDIRDLYIEHFSFNPPDYYYDYTKGAQLCL